MLAVISDGNVYLIEDTLENRELLKAVGDEQDAGGEDKGYNYVNYHKLDSLIEKRLSEPPDTVIDCNAVFIWN